MFDMKNDKHSYVSHAIIWLLWKYPTDSIHKRLATQLFAYNSIMWSLGLICCCVVCCVDPSGGLCGGSSEASPADSPQWDGGRHPHLYAWAGGYWGEGICCSCHSNGCHIVTSALKTLFYAKITMQQQPAIWISHQKVQEVLHKYTELRVLPLIS